MQILHLILYDMKKTMTINDDIMNERIQGIPTNQNGAIAIPQVPQFETDKEIGGFPIIDDIGSIINDSTSGEYLLTELMNYLKIHHFQHTHKLYHFRKYHLF